MLTYKVAVAYFTNICPKLIKRSKCFRSNGFSVTWQFGEVGTKKDSKF